MQHRLNKSFSKHLSLVEIHIAAVTVLVGNTASKSRVVQLYTMSQTKALNKLST